MKNIPQPPRPSGHFGRYCTNARKATPGTNEHEEKQQVGNPMRTYKVQKKGAPKAIQNHYSKIAMMEIP
jgi:hypothetical protein